MVNIDKKHINILLLICTFMGISFNILFYNKLMGINYFIYCLFLLIAFFWLIKTFYKVNYYYFALVSLIILSLGSIYFRSEFVLFRVLNFLLVPIVFVIFTVSIIKGNDYKKLIIDMFLQIFEPFGLLDKYIRNIFCRIFKIKKGKKYKKMMGVMIGIAICIPITLMILPLMAEADMVFNIIVEQWIEKFLQIRIYEYLLQLVILLFVASYLFGYVLNLIKEKTKDDIIREQKQKENNNRTVKANRYHNEISTSLTTVLVVVNIIYLVFSIIQFKYLFLGKLDGLNININYSRYARSGFFQMLTLTIINFLIIMIVRYFLKMDNETINKSAKVLLTMLTVFNYIIIASSFYRMYLYESAYGYTQLRLLVYLVLILESLLMIILIFGIWKTEFKVIRWGCTLIIIFYTFINFINIDAFIAKKNIDRYFETNKIDIEYLCYGLSSDALPQMKRLLDGDNIYYKQYVLESLQNFNTYEEDRSWQEYNISKKRALEISNKYKE